jgi:hypothetical protein
MRGWPLVLSAALILWRPLGFIFELLQTFSSLGMRGALGAVELACHGAVAVLSVVAVRALTNELPIAPTLAAAALIASAAASVQSLYWSALPQQTSPGTAFPLALIAVAHASVWLIYLKRSRRMRALAQS